MKKIKINKYLECISKYDIFDQSIDSAIKALQNLKQKYSEKGFDYLETCWDEDGIEIIGIRDETDAEYEKRMNKESAQEKAQEDTERELYEKLKKKYDNK